MSIGCSEVFRDRAGENPNTSYRYRFGVDAGTWNAKWGVDRQDNEYDCSGGDSAGSGGDTVDSDYWAVFVRPRTGESGGGTSGGH